MFHYQLRKSGPIIRIGATRAQADLNGLLSSIDSSETPCFIALNFSGIDAVNGSYVRASVAWLTRCALLSRSGAPDTQSQSRQDSPDPWEIRPLPIRAIFVSNLTQEVREEIDLYFKQERLPCLEALQTEGEAVISARILGHLDAQLYRTLNCLHHYGESAVAENLWKTYTDDGIGLTAWNNRLSELFQRLLVYRTKERKFWRYSRLFKEVSDGL